MHAYIIAALKKEMPSMFGKDGKKKELIKNLDNIYSTLQRVSKGPMSLSRVGGDIVKVL